MLKLKFSIILKVNIIEINLFIMLFNSYSKDKPYKLGFLRFTNIPSSTSTDRNKKILASSSSGIRVPCYATDNEALDTLKKNRTFIINEIQTNFGDIEKSRGLLFIAFYETIEGLGGVGLGEKAGLYKPYCTKGTPLIPLIYTEFFYLVDLISKNPEKMQAITIKEFLGLLNSEREYLPETLRKEYFMDLLITEIKTYVHNLKLIVSLRELTSPPPAYDAASLSPSAPSLVLTNNIMVTQATQTEPQESINLIDLSS